MASSIEDPSLSVIVLEALNQLIAAKPGEGGSDSQLIERLLSNLAHAKRFLERHDRLEEKLLNIKKEYRLQLAPEGQWSFVTEVLSLLVLLRVSLPAQESVAPSHVDNVAPPGLLSVKQEQTIRGALQFLSLLGIYPYLSHGVGVSLQPRTKSPVVLAKSNESIMTRNGHLCQCVGVLVHCLTHKTLASFILSSVMRCDILASLIQIVRANSSSSSHDSNTDAARPEYKAMLSSFMTMIQPSLIVQDLLLLQGSSGKVRSKSQTPQWFRSACGHLLSGLLIEENGLITVVRGIFGENIEGSSEGSKVFWLKCQGVAKIVSSCPSQMPSVSSYYAIMCPQVLALLKGEDRVCFMVACSVLSAMLSSHHDEAVRHLAIDLVDPLLVLTIPGSSIPLSQLSGLKILHKIVSVCEPGSPFYSFLFEFSPIMFALSRGINEHETKLAESSVAKELLIKTIKSANMANQLALFHHLMGIPLANPQKQTTTTLESIPESHDLVIVDDSLALRESIEGTCSQRVAGLGSSITGLLLDPELTGGKLIGSLFIVIIKHLVSLLCNSLQINKDTLLPMDSVSEDKGTSNVLLDLESRHSQSFSSTLVLYVAAALCENAGEKILAEVDSVTLVGSLVPIVKCHAINATRKLEMVRITEGSNVGLVGDHVTLSIAFGLLSAIMTANKEIPVKLRPLLSSVLPELETLSRNCDNSELATLAGELRICIATMGTVWTREEQSNSEPHNVTQTLEQTTPVSYKGSTPQNDRATVVEKTPVPKCLEKIFDYLRDPLLPVQGHGLIELTRLIENKDTSVVKHFEFVLATLTDHLEHSDSYIYTGAIRGIVAASFIDSSNVISLLCDYYTGFELGRRPVVDDKGLHVGSSDTTTSDRGDREFEKVMKVGEALIKIVDGLGDALPFHANRLISAFMINTRHGDYLIRASALSNLAELCGHMKFTFTGVENEVLSLLSNVIHFDTSNEVKRAGITVIKKIFESFQDQKSSVEELQPHVLQLYRLLKHVYENDSDPITRTSAQAALGGLDTIMRQYLFPTHTEKMITILP